MTESIGHDSIPGAAPPAALQTEAATSFYRCFFLHKSGCIDKANIVEAECDADALFWASRLTDPQSHTAIEIWQGARKVFPLSRARGDIEQLQRMLSVLGLLTADDPPASQS
jgi:hypothetical protein